MQFEPYPYQQYAIERIINEPCVGLFLGMALGKTVITLTAVERLRYERWEVSRCLVIAPKKVAETTWNHEAEKWDHLAGLRIVLVLGSAQKRGDALEQPGDVWVINRENVPWLVDYYRERWPFDMVVLDESSSFKNPRSKRFRALKLVRPRIRRLVELTGTPASRSLEDLWAQIYLLDQGQRLGKTLSSYRQAYFVEDRSYPGQPYRTYSPQKGALERIQGAISDICVSMRTEDYLSLPECVEQVIPVALDDKARKAYDKLERDMLLEMDGQTVTAASAAVLNGKLLQLCSGAIYGEDGKPVLIHSCKVEALLETVEQLHGEHALIFYWFQHERDRLTEALAKTGLRVGVYTGPEEERAWNAGELDLLLAHPASCAYGLNLQQGGHHAIWFGYPNWSLELFTQANARLHRQGQQYPVCIHLLTVQGGMDEDMVAALHAKGDVQAALLEALRARIERVKEMKK